MRKCRMCWINSGLIRKNGWWVHWPRTNNRESVMKKLLTIVIPSYNVETTLRQIVESLLVPDIKLRNLLDILIVNDGNYIWLRFLRKNKYFGMNIRYWTSIRRSESMRENKERNRKEEKYYLQSYYLEALVRAWSKLSKRKRQCCI